MLEYDSIMGKVLHKDETEFAATWPEMYNKKSREQKGLRIIATLANYFKTEKLKDLNLLDMGGSTGIIDNVLAAKFGNVIGVDVDKTAINFAQKHFKRKNLTFKTGDALNLSFKDKSFDVVVCTHVYEHVINAEKLFSEIYRLLKPRGVCYLAAINSWWPIEPHYDLPFLAWLPKSLGHVYIRITGKAQKYYETPLNYWQLRRMVYDVGFRMYDNTAKIIKDPVKYGYPKSWKWLSPIAGLATYLSPTLFWILEK